MMTKLDISDSTMYCNFQTWSYLQAKQKNLIQILSLTWLPDVQFSEQSSNENQILKMSEKICTVKISSFCSNHIYIKCKLLQLFQKNYWFKSSKINPLHKPDVTMAIGCVLYFDTVVLISFSLNSAWVVFCVWTGGTYFRQKLTKYRNRYF